jgi:hypothetical protein
MVSSKFGQNFKVGSRLSSKNPHWTDSWSLHSPSLLGGRNTLGLFGAFGITWHFLAVVADEIPVHEIRHYTQGDPVPVQAALPDFFAPFVSQALVVLLP